MPRYVYRCDNCNSYFQVSHGMREVQESCQLCEQTGFLTRVPQMPHVKKQFVESNNKVGQTVKDYIEENRDLLQEMKKEARGDEYGN